VRLSFNVIPRRREYSPRQITRLPPAREHIVAISLALLATPAIAGDVAASAPTKLSVTVYRSPDRQSGSFNLNNLGGFALVTETRVVYLPAGESRLRFEGVEGGIVPESAIVTGLPRGVIEKNRDAALLSPSALMQRAIGAQVTLVRTDPKSGKAVRVPAKMQSASEDGVVFETAEGVEALRCDGLPDTFSYARVPAGLSSKPTLSVLTRARQAITATVTLSYIAEGFDWGADYTATINPDGKTLNLGGWITLANGNGESLPHAQTQIVAGRLNRNRVAVDYNNVTQPQVWARCWPMGNTGHVNATSDPVPPVRIELVRPYQMALKGYYGLAGAPPPPPPPAPMAMRAKAEDSIVVTAMRRAEQLGDLKLYRIPATTIAARQTKQSRLIDTQAVPFTQVYLVDIDANGGDGDEKASILLRTKNTQGNKLGLPLPAGKVAVFEPGARGAAFVGEVKSRDYANDEEIEWRFGEAFNVTAKHITTDYVAGEPEFAQLAPGLRAVAHKGSTIATVTFSNANSVPVYAELRLRADPDEHIKAADQPMAMKDGRPIFRLSVPAQDSLTVHYVVE